jgi:hypothetical protein
MDRVMTTRHIHGRLLQTERILFAQHESVPFERLGLFRKQGCRLMLSQQRCKLMLSQCRHLIRDRWPKIARAENELCC